MGRMVSIMACMEISRCTTHVKQLRLRDKLAWKSIKWSEALVLDTRNGVCAKFNPNSDGIVRPMF